MEAALHDEGDELLAGHQVEALVAQEREFPFDVEASDLHLHVIAQRPKTNFSEMRA